MILYINLDNDNGNITMRLVENENGTPCFNIFAPRKVLKISLFNKQPFYVQKCISTFYKTGCF